MRLNMYQALNWLLTAAGAQLNQQNSIRKSGSIMRMMLFYIAFLDKNGMQSIKLFYKSKEANNHEKANRFFTLHADDSFERLFTFSTI